MSSSWYFVKDGQRNGPMRREELDARVAEGLVNGDTLVWRPGMAAWDKASSVAELGVPALPVPPPLPAMSTASWQGDAAEEAEFYPRADRPEGNASVSGEDARARMMARIAGAGRPNFAGFRIRLAAKAIDWVVLYGIGTLVERAVVALAFEGVAPAAGDWAGIFRLLAYTGVINTVIAIVYHVYFMSVHEATPGKRILGLRLVRADGGRLGAGRVIGRYFAEGLSTITFFAGYVMAAFDDEKRTLHDFMCDTRVVRGPREENE